MTREEAVQYFECVADGLRDALTETFMREFDDDGWRKSVQEQLEATNIAIAALREPAHEWVRTTDRLPVVEQVVVGLCGGKVDIYQMVNVEDFKRYVEYWCAIPHTAEVEE